MIYTITSREYKILKDFNEVREFLHNQYKKQGYRNLNASTLEYSHTHCAFNYMAAHRCRIWEDDGRIVGFAGFEFNLGDILMLADKEYSYLYNEMLEHAERQLSYNEDGKQYLYLPWEAEDSYMTELLESRGYVKVCTAPSLVYDYKKGFDHKPLPEGYELITLKDEDDIAKWDECLWRGFDHGTKEEYISQFEPADLDGRSTMQSAPHFRKDMAFVIKSKDGEYVCMGDIWIEEGNEIAYLEPLATVPEYRRKGLATILLMEAMKASQKYGATCCMGGTREFYTCIGFGKKGEDIVWRKTW